MSEHTINLDKRKRYLADELLLQRSNALALLSLYDRLSKQHYQSYEIERGVKILSHRLQERIDDSAPHMAKYIDETDAEQAATDANDLTAVLFPKRRGPGSFNALLDLQGLFILLSATEASLLALTTASYVALALWCRPSR